MYECTVQHLHSIIYHLLWRRVDVWMSGRTHDQKYKNIPSLFLIPVFEFWKVWRVHRKVTDSLVGRKLKSSDFSLENGIVRWIWCGYQVFEYIPTTTFGTKIVIVSCYESVELTQITSQTSLPLSSTRNRNQIFPTDYSVEKSTFRADNGPFTSIWQRLRCKIFRCNWKLG